MAVIDHHLGNPGFGAINWVDPGCCAAGEMVAFLAIDCGVPLAGPLAEALYTALATDTGFFSYGGTTAACLDIVAELVRGGLDVGKVGASIKNQWTLGRVRLTAEILANMDLRQHDGGTFHGRFPFFVMGGKRGGERPPAANGLCPLESRPKSRVRPRHTRRSSDFRARNPYSGRAVSAQISSYSPGWSYPAKARGTPPCTARDKNRAAARLPECAVSPRNHDNHTRIIVVELRTLIVGFVVDAVSEVLRIPASTVEPPPPLVSGIDSEYISGVGKLQDRLLILIDLYRLLSSGEETALAAL